MKLAFLFTFLSICVISVGQTGTPISFEGIVTVDSSVDQKELYRRAREWYADAFKTSKEVLQVQDKETGELLGSGAFEYRNSFQGYTQTNGFITFKVKVITKDGRYRYEFTNFQHTGSTYRGYSSIDFLLITDSEECPYKMPLPVPLGQKWRNKLWSDIKKEISDVINGMIQGLKKQMAKASSTDW